MSIFLSRASYSGSLSFLSHHSKGQNRSKDLKVQSCNNALDSYIALLAGMYGIVESNNPLWADLALQLASGKTGCIAQSVLQDIRAAAAGKKLTVFWQEITGPLQRLFECEPSVRQSACMNESLIQMTLPLKDG